MNRAVKPPIFTCFGDIAMAIGGYFEKYLTRVIAMLRNAAITVQQVLPRLQHYPYSDHISGRCCSNHGL